MLWDEWAEESSDERRADGGRLRKNEASGGGNGDSEFEVDEMLAGKRKGEFWEGLRKEGDGEKRDGRELEPIEVDGRRPGWIRLPSRT